ncbi:hypothetical protein E2C01_053479 [Portunus trituberculatus]|uniref:Uncharacterized protein n=1 Tax=Portunus trituberculatus TaxID=210409 RepID=A0A5B7GGW2_PORTR|nr:hypothetical protein [Portunus trituberculatus]
MYASVMFKVTRKQHRGFFKECYLFLHSPQHNWWPSPFTLAKALLKVESQGQIRRTLEKQRQVSQCQGLM